jgi:hypothetical protein
MVLLLHEVGIAAAPRRLKKDVKAGLVSPE